MKATKWFVNRRRGGIAIAWSQGQAKIVKGKSKVGAKAGVRYWASAPGQMAKYGALTFEGAAAWAEEKLAEWAARH